MKSPLSAISRATSAFRPSSGSTRATVLATRMSANSTSAMSSAQAIGVADSTVRFRDDGEPTVSLRSFTYFGSGIREFDKRGESSPESVVTVKGCEQCAFFAVLCGTPGLEKAPSIPLFPRGEHRCAMAYREDEPAQVPFGVSGISIRLLTLP